MKIQITIFALLSFVMLFGLIDSVYANTQIVEIPKGAAQATCEDQNLCYNPYIIQIEIGDTVQWINNDNAAHTVTSGIPENEDGIFDSGLFMTENPFSFTFDEPDMFRYFCIVHPWMVGSVVVTQPSGIDETITSNFNSAFPYDFDEKIHYTGKVSPIDTSAKAEVRILVDEKIVEIRTAEINEEGKFKANFNAKCGEWNTSADQELVIDATYKSAITNPVRFECNIPFKTVIEVPPEVYLVLLVGAGIIGGFVYKKRNKEKIKQSLRDSKLK